MVGCSRLTALRARIAILFHVKGIDIKCVSPPEGACGMDPVKYNFRVRARKDDPSVRSLWD
jgi:hypothetical protein